MENFLYQSGYSNVFQSSGPSVHYHDNYHVQALCSRPFHKVYSEDNISNLAEFPVHYHDNRRTTSFDAIDDDQHLSSVYGSNDGSPNGQSNCSFKSTKMISKKKAKEIDFIVNFKTEMCKYWEDNGYCHFGPKCAFAHGDFELRQKVKVLSSYKAKKCVHFHLEGYCPYGRRCQFVHSLRATVPEIKEKLSYQEKINDPAFFDAQQSECICKGRPRLPAFEQFTEEENVCTHSSC